jgi:hypothetical protein
MRYSLATLLGLAAFLGWIAQAHAQDAKVFMPASAWALDYGEDYCRLMRDFKRGDETVGLFLERTQPGPLIRPIVIGDSVKLFRGAQEIGYRLVPAGAPRTVQKLLFQTSDGQQYLNLGPTLFLDLPLPTPGAPPAIPPPYDRRAEADQAGKVTGITLDRGLTEPVVIETGSLRDAARALQVCADDLLTSWGLDAEKHKSLSRPAIPAKPTAGWLAANTIPFGDFAKLSGGNNEVRVMIDAQGKAISCHIQWPVLSPEINKSICASVMEKGAFVPALDQGGEAIASYWTASAFFLMPPFGGP